MIVKRGDTRNGIHATLIKDGYTVNLTGCNVFILIENGIESVAEVLNAEKGEVVYPLEKSAVDRAGFFNYEFKVEYPDKRIETFPNDGYLKLLIYNDLREPRRL